MITLDNICIRRWVLQRRRARPFSRLLRRLCLSLWCRLRLREAIHSPALLAGELPRSRLRVDGAIARLLDPPLIATLLNVVVGDGAAALGVAIDTCVRVVGVWVLEDDVPSVQQAGEEAQAAEGDVDEGISAAYTTFDPHCVLSVC